MLKFSVTAANQIRFLLRSVNEANADSVLRDLSQFMEYGVGESILLLQSCLDIVDLYKTDPKNAPLERVVVSSFKCLLCRPNFTTIFCESLRNLDVNESFLENIANALHMSVSEKIAIGLALSESENLDIRICGNNFCIARIEELYANPVGLTSSEQIQSILLFLQRTDGLSKHVDSFMQILTLVQQKDVSPFAPTPLLPVELCKTNSLSNMDLFNGSGDNDFDAILAEMEKEMSLGDIMKELGYGCTVDASQCKEILSLFLPLTEVTISKILGMIASTHTGLEDNQNMFSTFGLALSCNNLSDQSSLNTWNIDVLIDTIKQLAPLANWIQVIENLDHEGFYIPNQEAFSLFMSMYSRLCQEPFPLHAIYGSLWKNTDGQLSFLKYAVSAPAEVFTFVHSVRHLAYSDAMHDHKLQHIHSNHAWLCIDLLDVLCQLAERGHASDVRLMLDYPLQYCPEVLLLGMACINTAYNLLQSEVSSNVLPMILKNGLGIGILSNLWHSNTNLVLRGFVDSYNSDSDSITRILDICEEMKILSSVLDLVPFSFSIKLAALASRKELIDLEKWLSSSLNIYKDNFFEACLKFIKETHIGGSHDFSAKPFQHSGSISSLFADTTATFLKVLEAHLALASSSKLVEEMERLHISIIDANPRLQNGGATDSSTDGYADDIEAEANSYFQQMFSGQLAVDEMVQMLARFKESSVRREQLIFECMIDNLFEEYRFFHRYPEMQLRIVAILFGSVIKHQLVTHLSLGIALRCVLDALRKPPDSRMFVFGTKALEQFVDRLIEWPQYCNHILQISHLRNTHSELVTFIEQALARISSGHLDSEGGYQTSAVHHHGPSQATSVNVDANTSSIAQLSSPLQIQHGHENSFDDRQKASLCLSNEVKPLLSFAGTSAAPTGDASGSHKLQSTASAPAMLSNSPGLVRPARGATSTKFGSALNIETLVAAAEKRDTLIEAPVSEVQDKISFIINNISVANVEAKAKEFTEILKEPYFPWFAQYMVMKRASIEPNFHDLYLKFLDKVNSKALSREIIQATYENCKVLLGSELIKSSSEERSLLKNLGSWLGKLTIGRNQVLRAREIDPKSLIIEAYEKGLMIAVIPFTSKVLEPCQNSLAYQPPNPWTMGILGLLAEIYSMPNLKMNLKFDIEVLFKNLGVDLKDIQPTSLLRDRKREIEGNPDFSNKDFGASQAQVVEMKSGLMSPLNQVELPHEVAPSSNAAGGHTHLLSQYAPLHLSSGTLMEDEKLTTLGFSDQIPTAQGLLQAAPSQSSFSVNQLHTPIPNIGAHVVINQKLSALGLHLHFQRVVPHAMDVAINQTKENILSRLVSIATQTTKELVLKDYAMESDETRILNAAHLMVASLAGSLAHVTCKEPLRTKISTELRNLLQGLKGVASELLEQAVQLVTNDNLDLGCAYIEQAATDEAMKAVDDEINKQLALRRKHREGMGPTFFDSNMYVQGSMGVFPEALCPKPGHLSLSQQRVYEDFIRLPWQNQSSQSSHALPAGPSSSSANTGLHSAYCSVSGQLNAGFSPNSGNTGFGGVSHPVEVMESNPTLHLSVPSLHVGPVDGVTQFTLENDAISSFTSSASAPELHQVESGDGKESGSPSQRLPSPTPSEHSMGSSISEPSLSTRDALDKYQIVAQKLDMLVTNNAREAEVQGAITEVPEIILRCVSRDEAALAVAQKVFKVLYENESNHIHVSAHIAILSAIRDVCKLVLKELTSWVIYSDEERKFNKDITVDLIRSELLNLAEYNVHMTKLIDGGRNRTATEFAISLLQTLVTKEPKVISDLHNLVDALAKLAAKPGSPDSLLQLVELLKNPAANLAASSGLNVGKEEKPRQYRDKKGPGHSLASREEFSNVENVEPDPAGFREQVSVLFADWYRFCELPGTNDAECNHFILQLHQSGLLKGDDTTDRFFRILTELSVSHCISSEMINSGALQAPQQVQSLSFLAIDIYAKLVYSILKGSSKPFLLSKILAVTVRFIQKDAEEKKALFNPRPYFRLFINWLPDLCSLDTANDGANFQILTAFANAFHALQPLKVPAFSFAWLELVSHRSFMPNMLTGNGQMGWPHIQHLLVDLFQFMEPFLRNAELGVPVHFLYKGILRVLLVLLHDFPEFLCDYHFTFCDVIPPSCIQMRNIILSAFPRNMRLPDPSTPNLKIDLLQEINQSPCILSEVDAALKAKQMKADVDEYLKTRQQNSSFLTELKQKLLLAFGEAATAGTRYNVPLINSLVLYVGMQAIEQLQARTAHTQATQTVPLAVFLVGAALDIFQTLIVDLDTEGRYLFLNAVANQLRYPNTHTHYFSFILLYLFAESNQEIIQEQITRVLLERLIVNRPHPWGLLITFIELIKNPRYNFWNRSFIRCAPEIEKLFESVSRSCGGPKPVDDSMVSGWASENAH